jgi:hypothetical protein
MGLSLILATARVAPKPIERIEGDIRFSSDRFRWPISWSQNRLLERAAETPRGQRATSIHKPAETADNSLGLKPGDLVPHGQHRSRVLPGGC